jgi:membrane-bound serine protease (ClpP class)
MRPLIFILFIFCFGILGKANAQEAKAQKVFVLPLADDIGPAAVRSVIKGMEAAQKAEADLILVEMNTYGGELSAADTIRNRFLYSPIPVWVFIESNAGSAGAIIALACDSIYMKPGAIMGAATVVNGQGEKMPEKYQSFVRAKMRETAIQKGRDPLIAEAMVDEAVSIPEVKSDGKLITFTVDEAIQFGFCEGSFPDRAALISSEIGENAIIMEQENTFLDQVIRFFLHPAVSSLLMLVMVIGLITEIRTPGVGLPGAAALVAGLLYFVPAYLEGLAANWEILLILAGILLLVLEIFVIPGFGVAGVLGIVFLAGGMILSLVPEGGSQEQGWQVPEASLLLKATLTVGAILLIGMVGSIAVSGGLLMSGWMKKVAVVGEQKKADGWVAVEIVKDDFTGVQGTVVHTLKPMGWVQVNGKRVEARVRHGVAEQHEPVRFLFHEHGIWVVERIHSSEN